MSWEVGNDWVLPDTPENVYNDIIPLLKPGDRIMLDGKEYVIPEPPMIIVGTSDDDFTITGVTINKVGPVRKYKAKRGKYWEREFGNVSRETNGTYIDNSPE